MTETNFEQVAAVPFFVKASGQTEGRVDDDIVRNIDVVPTVADAARNKVWWKHDGRSVFSAAARARERVSMPRRDFSRVISFSRGGVRARRARAARSGGRASTAPGRRAS